MNKVFLILLLKYVLSSKILDELLRDILEIIPEPSQSNFYLNYTTFLVYFNTIRFFKPITEKIIVSSLEDSLKAEKILLTAAIDIKMDIGQEYYYPDFLLEFSIIKFTPKKSLRTGKYEIDLLKLDNMFISQVIQQEFRFIRSILFTNFNNVIHSYYLLMN